MNFGGGSFTSVGPNFDDAFIVKLDSQGNHVWSKKLRRHQLPSSSRRCRQRDGRHRHGRRFPDDDDVRRNRASTARATPTRSSPCSTRPAPRSGPRPSATSRRSRPTPSRSTPRATSSSRATPLGAIDFGQGAQPLAGTQNAWAAKLSGAGAVTWGKLYGASKASGEGIGADATGNVYFAGDHEGKIDFGGGALDNTFGPNVYVAKLDPLGKEIWSHTYGDSQSQHAKGLSVDGKGHAVVAGTFSGSIDFGKGMLTSGGGVDGFVAKLDTQGCGTWQKGFGDASFQSASGVSADATGQRTDHR